MFMPNSHETTTYVAEVPQIGVTSVSDSQISVRFALRPAVFGFQAILRKVHGHCTTSGFLVTGHFEITFDLE